LRGRAPIILTEHPVVDVTQNAFDRWQAIPP
jgi:hypothetical protein